MILITLVTRITNEPNTLIPNNYPSFPNIPNNPNNSNNPNEPHNPNNTNDPNDRNNPNNHSTIILITKIIVPVEYMVLS